MDTKTLLCLAKEELVKLIEDLQLQIALQRKGIPDVRIDYQYLVETASDVIFVLDDHGNIVYQNAAWEDLFPFNRGEAIGMHFSVSVPAIEIERATALFDSVIHGEKEIRNEKFKTYDKNGNLVYLLANLTPLRTAEGKISGLLGILRNITEMHYMERKLKVNSRRLEEKIKEQIDQAEELKRLKALNDEIINNAPLGIFTIDPTGIILTENPAIKEIIGYPADQTIIGTNINDLKGFSRGEFQKVLDEVMLQRKAHKIKNAKYNPTDGLENEQTLNLRIIPILDSEKKVKSIMLMAEDVTEQARIGMRMQRAEQLSAMGLLAAGVAYELKVPINLLTIDLNFIENNIPEDSPMKDYVKSMKDELTRMKQISDQLLNLSKPEEIDKEVFEIHKLITSHPIQIMLNRLKKNGYIVNTVLPDESMKIRGIRNQLTQALLHLIANAEEAMPDRGELRIEIGAMENSSAKFGTITVTDTGIGITRDNIKKIIQPFFTTKGEKSTGLGMMVTYSIIENHGGTMGIRSKPGEGTSIVIALPGVDE